MENAGMTGGFWSDKRVFVTGATGLVGSWLARDLLAAGAYVVVLVRDVDPQSEFYRSGTCERTAVVNGSLEEFQTLERAISEYEVDTVFHLAAQPLVEVAYRSPLQTFEANIRGTYHLLEACRIHNQLVRRIVTASSDKAYGEHEVLPYTEDMPLLGRYPYEVSKSCADLIAQSYYHTYALPVTIARCGNIYGGGDLNWSRIVPGTIRSFLRNQSPVIRSDGNYIRDYIYIKDVTRAYMRLAESLEDARVVGHAFNFGPERPLTVLELVTAIQEVMNCHHITPTIQNRVKGEILSQYLSFASARRVLGWQPQFTLVQGLSETIVWYQEFLSN